MTVSKGALSLALLLGGTGSALAVQDIVVTDEAQEAVLFQADAVVRQEADGPVVATGNVRATYGDRLLTADRVTFDPATDIVTASGDVAIYEPDGQVFFADEIDLTGDLRDGVATNFSALLEGDGRLAGSSAVRNRDGTNTLNNAVYTACEVCAEDGDERTPTWAIKALRVTQDENDKVIRFRNAVVEVLGVPIFYTPYVQVPDPSVKRQSGLLAPRIGTSSRLGFELEVPVYWAISDHQDVTFRPRHMTELGTLLQGEYRVRTRDAGAVIQTGFISPKDGSICSLGSDVPLTDQQLSDAGIGDIRWHFFGSAFKELNDGWLAEADLNLVGDDAYLQFYDVEPEGQLQDVLDVIKPDRLVSELAFTKREADRFTDISAIGFQSLRAVDDDDFQAFALPRVTHTQRFDMPRLGGDLEVVGNFLYLNRAAGLDTARALASATYEKAHTTRGGHRLRGFAQLRGDVYRFEDADLGVEACNVEDANFDTCRQVLPRNGEDDGFTTTRLLPTVGAEWSYPLAKLTDRATYILEPRAQLVVSPEEDFSRDIFNEDSQFFQFDTVTLFDWSKASGYDQWEDGTRLNYGLSGTAVYTNGFTIAGLVGQQIRAAETNVFDADTGLGEETSDIVGQIDLRYGSRFSLDNRFRFDKEDATLNRGESTLRANVGRFSTVLSYLRVETQELEAAGTRDEFLTASAAYQLTDRWSVGGGWRENLATGETTAQSILLRYRDQCTIFTVNYRFDNTVGTGVGTNESLTFNIDLAGI